MSNCILAIETACTRDGVAALAGEAVLAERRRDQAATARWLAPAIRDVMAEAGWSRDRVGLVAVAKGPGSFTGLRIGVMTAKTLAYAWGVDLLGIDTLEAIAAQAPTAARRLAVAIDAQRGQWYAGTFERSGDGSFECQTPARIVEPGAWLAGLAADTQVSGPALESIADRLPEHIVAVGREYWWPTAVSVGRLAARRYAAGDRDDAYRLVPQYLRRSAAEEKWRGRHENP